MQVQYVGTNTKAPTDETIDEKWLKPCNSEPVPLQKLSDKF